MKPPTDLERSILRTILWFSLFQYPLTTFEIWKWMIEPERPYGLAEIYRSLATSEWLQMKLETIRGFYALKGSKIDQCIEGRGEKFLDAERKLKSLKRAAKYFHLLPAVRAVGAVNTLAWWSTTEKSDIDLFVITRSGHIWSSRFWLVLPFLLVGKRPDHSQHDHGNTQDPFCFSFFASTQSLPMEPICIEKDYYMAFWIHSLIPIVDRAKTFDSFFKENRWVSSLIPHAYRRSAHANLQPMRIPAIPVQHRPIESVFRVIQRRRFPENLQSIANVDSRVVVTDEMLKFHENDRREAFRDQFESLLERHL